jgi:DNA-binding transcriptional MerR regulator
MNMKETPVINGFRAADAGKLSGISPAMLDYLTREGFISPSASVKRGRGIRRIYTFGDIVTLKVIAQLLRSGIEIRRLRRGLRNLQKRMADAKPGELPFRFLVTDGTEVFFRDSFNLESLTRDGQFAFAFLIDIHRYGKMPSAKELSISGYGRRAAR